VGRRVGGHRDAGPVGLARGLGRGQRQREGL
jgi:hypothetical protein